MPPLAGGKTGNTEEDGDDHQPHAGTRPVDNGMDDAHHINSGLVL